MTFESECRISYVFIEGLEGVFYGPVKKNTNIPSGCGVFTVGDWIHCGNFCDGIFNDG